MDAFASSAPDRSQAHPYAIGGERTLRAAATVAACVGACLPIIVSTLRALSAGAVPNGDRAMIAIRSYDVFTSNTPLTGQFSAITVVTRVATHSLGPMLYWLLAVPSRIGPPAMNLTMGIVNCACVAGCVLIARRRGGQTLMFAVATALALMLLSLGTEVYHDIFNASAGVLPLTLLISMCWSLGCGDYRLLPAAVVVASFVAQAEMTFLGPAVLLVVVGCLALAFTLDRVRRGCPWEGMRGAKLRGDRAPRLWKWTLASAVLLVVCWAPVAIQEAINHPGNLTLVGRAALKHKRVLGPADGWHAVVHAVGVPPWWLTVPKDTFFERLTDVTTVPSTFSQVTAMAILAAILAVTVFSVVRRRLDVALAGIFALGLCLALGSVAGENPKNHLLALSVGYTMWWGSPAGMWAWLTLACGAVALLARRGLALGDPARRVSAVIGVCAALTAGIVVSAVAKPDRDIQEYAPLHAIVPAVVNRIPAGQRQVRIAGSHSWGAFDFKGEIAYELRRRGIRPVFNRAYERVGTIYEPVAGRRYPTIWVWDGRKRVRRAYLVGRFRYPPDPGGTVTVAYAPAR